MQGLRSGRLLAYSPASKKTSVVAEEFLFPNGVAVSADGSYLLMVETGAARIWKLWLQGAKVGLVTPNQSKLDPGSQSMPSDVRSR